MQINTKTIGSGEVSSNTESRTTPSSPTSLMPLMQMRKHLREQQAKLQQVRAQAQDISELVQQHLKEHAARKEGVKSSNTHGVAPTSSNSDGMPGTTLRTLGELVVLPNGRTARVERVETTVRTIDGTMSPGGTITRNQPIRTAPAKIVLPSGRTSTVSRSEVQRESVTEGLRSIRRTVEAFGVLSPTSQPGRTIVLPNGKTATITRCEISDPVTQVEASSTRIVAPGMAGAVSPTSAPGATVILPNGRTATVLRCEVSAPITQVEASSTRTVTGDTSGALSPTSRPGATVMLPNGKMATITRCEVTQSSTTRPRRSSSTAGRAVQKAVDVVDCWEAAQTEMSTIREDAAPAKPTPAHVRAKVQGRVRAAVRAKTQERVRASLDKIRSRYGFQPKHSTRITSGPTTPVSPRK